MSRVRSTAFAFAGLLATPVLLAGCSSGSGPVATVTVTATAESTTSARSSTPASAAPSSTSPDSSQGLTAKTAIDAALAKVPGGAAVEGGRTDEGAQQVWYIVVRDKDGVGTELYLSSATGELVRQRPASLSRLASGELPTLTARQGLTAAMAEVPGSQALEFDLETEHGIIAWYVVVGDARGLTEVYVNADTEAIISTERDS
ncbi:hypothetical protein PROP_02512 [Propionicimonas sp. T2.31MG-18]|uniref:PepSY domain-containing protein n=1 Tax=Propionicimonas sp. T2.31MG-18 TaxID=3157620 RepID=UPI0035EF0442